MWLCLILFIRDLLDKLIGNYWIEFFLLLTFHWMTYCHRGAYLPGVNNEMLM